MKQKSAQLTILVVIGVLIAGAIGGVILLNTDILSPAHDEKVIVMKENLLNCFESRYEATLLTAGYQGGYLSRPDIESLESNNQFIPYYYHNKEVIMPEIEEIERNIEEEISKDIGYCIYIFNEKNREIELSHEDIDSEVSIFEEEVSFIAKTEIYAEYENKTVKVDLSKEEIFIDSKIKKMHQMGEIIAKMNQDNPYEWIGISRLYQAAKERGLEIEIIDIEEDTNTYLFTLKDPQEGFYPSRFNILSRYLLRDVPFPSSPSQE